MSGLTGDWDDLINMLSNNPIKKTLDISKKQIGIKGAGMVKRGIRDSAPGGKQFVPLAKFDTPPNDHCKLKRKGTKPLIDNGDLIGSITYEDADGGVWIGARRGRRTKDGKDVVDIADVHERGRTIKVTPKMRAYLHSQGLHLKPTTQYIHIPARPYISATVESQEFKEMCLDVVMANVKAAIKI